SKHQVPVIAPVPVSEDIGMDNVFFAYTPEKVTRSRMIDHVLTTMDDQNIIVIADAKNAEAKAELIQAFPEAKVAKVVEERKNVALNLDEFVTLLSKETDNWVFLETGDPNLVSSVSSILNSHRTKEIRIRMFTTNHGNAFENDVISNAHLSNLNFTYPSVYRRSGNDDFVKSYRKRYGMEPDKYATWGFDLVYDLLLKLAYKPNLMEVSSMVGETEYSASKFSYEKEYAGGYYNQASYLMQYDNLRIKPLKE
ncbi:MAG: peptidoglycan-binding protein LysM, partial [Flavobacteriaceae bacterium]